MGSAAVTDQQDIKKEKILEAAHSRFSHYGYSKTTMNEIAGDIAMSKALLYYYFPDKSELYAAVMRKLANDYLKILTDHQLDDLKDVFIFQVTSHHEFIVSNYNFFDYFRVNEQNLPDTIWGIIDKIRQGEAYLLVNSIKAEIEKGGIRPLNNPNEIVELLLDALHGVWVGALSHKKNRFPKMEHLDAIHTKRLMLIDIFIKGLKY